MNNIHKDLERLAHPIDDFEFLENNPRAGNVAAISASYERFEQVKPIIAMKEGDKNVVIAGNHQLMAARALGWDKIAVVFFSGTSKEAIEFALTDNRVSELGTTDTDLIHEHLSSVIDGNEDFYDILGWDDFELVAMEPDIIDESVPDSPLTGWEPPHLINRDSEDDELHFSGNSEDEEKLVSQGATSVGVSGKPNAVIQYTLVFENAEQQSTWYEFLRWMKGKPDDFPGETTAEQFTNFLSSTEFGDEQ